MIVIAYNYRRVLVTTALVFAGIASCGAAHGEPPSTRKLILTYTLTEGADLASQEWALRQGRGCVGHCVEAAELVPWMRGPLNRRAALKLTTVLVLAGGSKALAQDHPKLERWVRRGLIARAAVAVALNVVAGRKAKEGARAVQVPSR